MLNSCMQLHRFGSNYYLDACSRFSFQACNLMVRFGANLEAQDRLYLLVQSRLIESPNLGVPQRIAVFVCVCLTYCGKTECQRC